MENMNPVFIISDFIYNYPEVVVKTLQDNGYIIDVKTATLPQITELVFYAIDVDGNKKFAKELGSAIDADGNANFVMVATLAVTLVSSIITGLIGKKEATKQRALQEHLALANLAQNEKLFYEKLKAETETARTGILANTLMEYRKSLQVESTARLKNTWVYVLGIGLGISSMVGIYLIGKK